MQPGPKAAPLLENFVQTLEQIKFIEGYFNFEVEDPELLTRLLNVVAPVIPKEGDITINRAKLSPTTFHHLIEKYKRVNLTECHLESGWWDSVPRESVCNLIDCQSCSAEPIPDLVPGMSAWSNLTWLAVRESNFGPHRLRTRAYVPMEEKATGGKHCQSFTRDGVTALWHAQLETLIVDRADQVEFLADLPPAPNLKNLWVYYTPISKQVFFWILGSKAVYDLDFSWLKGTLFPWQRLNELPKLRHLSFNDTFLNDNDLAAILKNRRLWSMDIYYTDITAASWGPLLRSSLVAFTGSSELYRGEFPTDLPPKTKLKSVHALNADPGPYRKILGQYPDVKVTSDFYGDQ